MVVFAAATGLRPNPHNSPQGSSRSGERTTWPHVRHLRVAGRHPHLRPLPLHGRQPDDDRPPLRPPRPGRTRARGRAARLARGYGIHRRRVDVGWTPPQAAGRQLGTSRPSVLSTFQAVSRDVARARECPRVPKCTRLVPAKRRKLAIAGNTKCPFAGLLGKPSDGLEPSTPSLPWNVSGNRWQPVATDLACLRRFCAQSICR
jgi:hypothetical protein